jgi:aquaporin Z
MLVEAKAGPTISWWTRALTTHWPEYCIEAGCLALFMVSACIFGTLLGHPESPVVELVQDPTLLRVFMGLAMGTTAVALIYSGPGKRSGAHMNPSTTLAFLRLGKIETADAVLYMAAQFAGGVLGVGLAAVLLGGRLSHASVNYVVTVPGPWGVVWAFLAEATITFLLMSVILRVSNTPRFNRYTGLCAGLLVLLYISIEAPVSGMSMNPARTLGSAWSAGDWTSLWVYFTAPPLGMLLAAELYVRRRGLTRVLCAKLHHENSERCIFRCNYPGR